MIAVDLNYCQIVKESLAGERAVDEQTFTSLAVLSERLERLKNLDKIFGGVTFSPSVKKLKGREKTVAV